jgi:DNA helicase-2/ATP-dependent DNA helicase PcrA
MTRVINTPPRGLGKQSLDELDRRAKDFGVSHWEAIAILTDPAQPPAPGISPRALNSLRNFQKIITGIVAVAQREPASEVVKAAILDSGYADYLKQENSEEGGGLRDFIDSAALVSDTDQYEQSAPVTMMTMHSAKGLEFPVVFIVGLEDGLFPHSRSATDPAELEEERRLCYVAITRAEQSLYVSHAMKRRVYGEEMVSEPSQFLNEMPLELLEDLSRGPSWLSFASSSTRTENLATARALRGQPREERRFEGKTYNSVDSIAEFFRQRGQQLGQTPTAAPKQQPVVKRRADAAPSSSASSSSSSGGDFAPGTHVRHAKYGRGLVLRREGAGDSAKLTVSFPGYGQKKLIEKYAGLEKA